VLNDQGLQEQFEQDGFVRLPLLGKDEIQVLRAELRELRPHDRFIPDERTSGASYHCSFLDTNLAYRRQVSELLRRVFQPHVDRVLAGYEILNCNFYIKPPGKGEFTVHQNWPGAELDVTTVTLWCPLVETRVENGAIRVVPGSQKLFPHIETAGVPGYFAGFAEKLKQRHLEAIPMGAGEAIIFDDSLLHWSGANRSDEPRVAIQISCIPRGTTPLIFIPSGEGFEKIAADAEFYLTNQASDLRARQPCWRSLGFVPSPNRRISYREFRSALDAANSRRGRPAPARRGRLFRSPLASLVAEIQRCLRPSPLLRRLRR
jgi:hypothetical protein